MCVIIIKQKNNVMPKDVAKSSATINPHGLGIVWLDTFEVTYHKSNEYKLLLTERPFIAHFRYATVGKVGLSNTHPFVCGSNKDELLMMNGTIKGMGCHEMCDSKELAISLGDVKRSQWKKELEKHDSRFVTVNLRTKSFQIYNRNLYTYRDGIWYSKANVLQDNIIAVYGTLKKGFNNYFSYLTKATYLGSGKTQEKYPLIVEGLPYMVDKKGTGHNVVVDVFKVNDQQLDRVDQLESHPNWYQRKQVNVKVEGKLVKAWIYFNPKKITSNTILHKSYEQNNNFASLFDFDEREVEGEVYNENERHDTYEIGWDDNDFPTDTTPYCIECYNDVEHDGFANYYCSACGGWFTEKEILKNHY